MSTSIIDPRAIRPAVNNLLDGHRRSGYEFTVTVSTASMWPALAPGDRVRLRSATIAELRPGDVIAHRVGENLIVHRLIQRIGAGDETLLVTKGDNSAAADAPWPAAQCVGLVTGIARRGTPFRIVAWRQAGVRAGLIAWLSYCQLQATGITSPFGRKLVVRITKLAIGAAARRAQ